MARLLMRSKQTSLSSSHNQRHRLLMGSSSPSSSSSSFPSSSSMPSSSAKTSRICPSREVQELTPILWTKERNTRLRNAIEGLGGMMEINEMSARAIYEAMNDPDPRLNPQEVLRVGLLTCSFFRSLHGEAINIQHPARGGRRGHHHQQQNGPVRKVRHGPGAGRQKALFSPYANSRKVSKDGGWEHTTGLGRGPYKWTLDEHRRFLDAVEISGGLDRATPKGVLMIMARKDKAKNSDDGDHSAPTLLDILIHLSRFRNFLAGGKPQSYQHAAGSPSVATASGALSNTMDALGGLKLT